MKEKLKQRISADMFMYEKSLNCPPRAPLIFLIIMSLPL